MFYDDDRMAFQITGVYRVDSGPGSFLGRGRSHTALSIRIRGDSRIHWGDREVKMKNGTVGYFPAGVDYVRTVEEAESFIAIHLRCFGDTDRKIETVDGCESLLPLFEELYTQWKKGGTAGRNRCMRLLYGIFEKLSTLTEQGVLPPAAIARGVAHMREHYQSKELSVSALAAMCNVSEVYFRRIYREWFGESPMQTILDLRFAHAKELLLSGYYPTKTIADMAGFSDVKYFRTAFKKRFGLTPAEYAGQREGKLRET